MSLDKTFGGENTHLGKLDFAKKKMIPGLSVSRQDIEIWPPYNFTYVSLTLQEMATLRSVRESSLFSLLFGSSFLKHYRYISDLLVIFRTILINDILLLVSNFFTILSETHILPTFLESKSKYMFFTSFKNNFKI